MGGMTAAALPGRKGQMQAEGAEAGRELLVAGEAELGRFLA